MDLVCCSGLRKGLYRIESETVGIIAFLKRNLNGMGSYFFYEFQLFVMLAFSFFFLSLFSLFPLCKTENLLMLWVVFFSPEEKKRTVFWGGGVS